MISITLGQGIALAILAVIVGVDFWLEALFIFRPIIVCTLAGLILGDLQTGLIVGGLTELAFAGLTPAGGTQPPNPILAGIMGVVIAHTVGVTPQAALGLALPFSLLMQYIILLYYSVFSFFMPMADRYAAEANTKAFIRLNLLMTAIVAVTYGVVVFLSVYVAQDAMRALVQSMPAWLTHGLSVAGGILPAVGFAMLMGVMFNVEYTPFLIIGFWIASFIPFSNILPVAVIGAALAIYEYFNIQRNKSNAAMSSNVSMTPGEGGEENEGI
ncbi:PTS galactosamine transporter subunit IIC [Coprothermobacter platensis]|uniref:PTS galactosamine transporter subunit IIC n=1 Tax=Coprothermobacter platensis TaxID=108819 RepID=UPI00036263B3|nr:PTS galactosamine transporter subunit IIC [Coprothermobacter platensis]